MIKELKNEASVERVLAVDLIVFFEGLDGFALLLVSPKYKQRLVYNIEIILF